MSYPPLSTAGIYPPRRIVNIVPALSVVPSSGGTLTLTNTSTQQQLLTGTNTHIVILPVVSTLVLGQQYDIKNETSKDITIQSSGLNIITTIPSKSSLIVTCIALTGTTPSSWTYQTLFNSNITGIPGFSITGSYEVQASQALMVSSGAAYIWTTTTLNTNNQYNTMTGVFTIPITGWYGFSLDSETTNGLGIQFQLIGRVTPANQDIVFADTTLRGVRAKLSHLMRCDINQTFFWKCIGNPIVGGKQTLRIFSLF